MSTKREDIHKAVAQEIVKLQAKKVLDEQSRKAAEAKAAKLADMISRQSDADAYRREQRKNR